MKNSDLKGNLDLEEVYEYFAEITGLELTSGSRDVIDNLIDSYGIVKLMKNIPDLKSIDPSLFLVSKLNESMNEQYCTETYSYNSDVSDQDWDRAIHILTPLLMDSKAPMKTGEIVEHLFANGITFMTRKDAHSRLSSLRVRYCGIRSTERGCWWHEKNIDEEKLKQETFNTSDTLF